MTQYGEEIILFKICSGSYLDWLGAEGPCEILLPPTSDRSIQPLTQLV